MEEAFTYKTVWSDEDFECMKWKECKIFGIAFQPEDDELILDLDYVFQWLGPKVVDEKYIFSPIRSPATMVFENVNEFEMKFEYFGTTIEEICRTRIQPTSDVPSLKDFEWQINGYNGEMKIVATGFKKYVRAPDIENGYKTLNERGGICFDRIYTK